MRKYIVFSKFTVLKKMPNMDSVPTVTWCFLKFFFIIGKKVMDTPNFQYRDILTPPIWTNKQMYVNSSKFTNSSYFPTILRVSMWTISFIKLELPISEILHVCPPISNHHHPLVHLLPGSLAVEKSTFCLQKPWFWQVGWCIHWWIYLCLCLCFSCYDCCFLKEPPDADAGYFY